MSRRGTSISEDHDALKAYFIHCKRGAHLHALSYLSIVFCPVSLSQYVFVFTCTDAFSQFHIVAQQSSLAINFRLLASL